MTDNITVNAQSSIRIADGDRVIYADPFRIQGEPHDADIIFITHEHFDHFSSEDIEKVKKDGTVIVVPESMAGKVHGAVTIKAGDRTVIGGIEVEAVRAYNKLLPFHPKSAGWVGYILTVGGSRIYIAGDTDATDEAKAVRCDIALVPIGGKFTMDAKAAAALVN
ncbi:MAG: MBL fold metallo-hydrolase, partial [Oscillospiraceae bacterium]|nr:MBL fold metallo-hydrolase [Oscillospiraceae bacterium]